MIDFLRENHWCSQEQYLWGMTVGQIKLASFDFTHIEHIDKDAKPKRKNEIYIESAEDLKNMADLGFPIIR